MPREVHLSSFVVHARPERAGEVRAAIADLGCEVHGEGAAGKLIVTLETDDQAQLGQCLTDLQLLPGVLAATLVFHHVEEADALGAPPAATTITEGPR